MRRLRVFRQVVSLFRNGLLFLVVLGRASIPLRGRVARGKRAGWNEPMCLFAVGLCR